MTEKPEPLPEEIAQEVERVLAARSEDQDPGIEELCAAHPEHTGAIRLLVAECEAMHARLREFFSGGDSEEQHPEQIGPYRVLEKLGEGGFGTVYLAERRDPFQKRVAVKVVKPGMDSRAVLRRFEVERQAIALMEHENIAKVLDAGLTENQRPFFAMEYVKGEPITRYCDQQRLSVRQRLELFLDVCAGVQHAHHKGVIHRDLTPNNVLVTVQDERPVPKIIDFGLARATDHRLLQQTVYTELGRFLGTPEYMSPEQASGGKIDVDARTDVYSLGVLLYELLTGSTPFRRGADESIEEIRARITELEPKKPSTRVTSLDETVQGEVAKQRRAEARALGSRFRGDLDWITMKALAKDRVDRYGSPGAFADDVRRHLNDQPVEAGPPALGYQLGKMVRRHRGRFVAAGLVLLAVLGGAVGMVFFGLHAEENAKREAAARADYEKLLVGAEVKALQAAAEQAQPIGSAQVAVLRDLVARARALVERMPDIQALLDELAHGHVQPDPQPRGAKRGVYPENEELRQVEALIAKAVGENPSSKAVEQHIQEKRTQLEKERDEIRSRRDRSNSVAIPGDKERFLHDQLEATQVELRRIRDELLPDLEYRLEWSRKYAAQKAGGDDGEAAWTECLARIAKNGKYGKLELRRQEGLVPLGPDPESKLEEFGHPLSGEVPARGKDGKLQFGKEPSLVFVLLPPGKVQVGRHDLMPEDQVKDLPQHDLPATFVSKFELTRSQWERLANGVRSVRAYRDTLLDVRNLTGDQRDKPMNAVSWHQSVALLRRTLLDLPEDVLWEYACKAGTTSRWYTGNTIASLGGARRASQKPVPGCAANFGDGRFRTRQGVVVFVDGFYTHVGNEFRPKLAPARHPFKPNRFGLHHMHGNIAEWCRDRVAGRAVMRHVRGGSFMNTPFHGQSAFRNRTNGSDASRDIGLRPMRKIDP